MEQNGCSYMVGNCPMSMPDFLQLSKNTALRLCVAMHLSAIERCVPTQCLVVIAIGMVDVAAVINIVVALL